MITRLPNYIIIQIFSYLIGYLNKHLDDGGFIIPFKSLIGTVRLVCKEWESNISPKLQNCLITIEKAQSIESIRFPTHWSRTRFTVCTSNSETFNSTFSDHMQQIKKIKLYPSSLEKSHNPPIDSRCAASLKHITFLTTNTTAINTCGLDTIITLLNPSFYRLKSLSFKSDIDYYYASLLRALQVKPTIDFSHLTDHIFENFKELKVLKINLGNFRSPPMMGFESLGQLQSLTRLDLNGIQPIEVTQLSQIIKNFGRNLVELKLSNTYSTDPISLPSEVFSSLRSSFIRELTLSKFCFRFSDFIEYLNYTTFLKTVRIDQSTPVNGIKSENHEIRNTSLESIHCVSLIKNIYQHWIVPSSLTYISMGTSDEYKPDAIEAFHMNRITHLQFSILFDSHTNFENLVHLLQLNPPTLTQLSVETVSFKISMEERIVYLEKLLTVMQKNTNLKKFTVTSLVLPGFINTFLNSNHPTIQSFDCGKITNYNLSQNLEAILNNKTITNLSLRPLSTSVINDNFLKELSQIVTNTNINHLCIPHHSTPKLHKDGGYYLLKQALKEQYQHLFTIDLDVHNETFSRLLDKFQIKSKSFKKNNYKSFK